MSKDFTLMVTDDVDDVSDLTIWTLINQELDHANQVKWRNK